MIMKFGVNSPVRPTTRQSPNLEVNPNFVNLWKHGSIYKRFVSGILQKKYKLREKTHI
jgi:hypothetical protein